MATSANDVTGPVLSSLGEISGFLLSYATTLAALGALTVAILEAWKKLRDSQAKFHRASVLSWFENDGKKHYFTAAPKKQHASELPELDTGCAYEELLILTTGVGRVGDAPKRRYESSLELTKKGKFNRSIEYALFELDVDRLMGQIQDAADIALNNPKIYPHLFQFLTRSALPEDVANWVEEVGTLVASTTTSEQTRKDIADRYTRLKQIVRRHLDSFQIVTALRWREWNQFAAILVGAGLLLAAQLIELAHESAGIGGALAANPFLALKIALVSVFGGMLAPVAKDLVDALRKVKAGV
jgi:hypothetical protein